MAEEKTPASIPPTKINNYTTMYRQNKKLHQYSGTKKPLRIAAQKLKIIASLCLRLSVGYFL